MSEEKKLPIGLAHDFSLLRQEAEKLQRPVSVEEVQNMTPHEVRLLIQELQIHQVELEMQNHQLQLTTQELQAAQDKYQHLYHYAPFGYVTLDEHGIIEEANAKGMELLASRQEQLLARRFSQFVHPESLDAFYGFFRQVLLSDKPQTVELEIMSPNGTVFYAQLEGILLRRENDTDQCRIAFVDVTERKTAYIALFNKEALLSTIINSSLNAIQVFRAVRNGEGTLIDFEWVLLNRTAELFLDHNLEQLRRHRLTDLLPSLVEDGYFFTFMKVVEDGQTATFTAHLFQQNREYWLNCVAVNLEDGFVLTFEDVTQQRITHTKLQESQLLLKKMAETLPDILYIEDLQQGRNIYNNRDFLAYLGYTATDYQGHPRDFLNSLFHPADAHLVFEREKRFAQVKDGEFLEFNVRIKNKAGDWLTFCFKDTVFKRGSAGQPVQLVGTAQDITKRLKTEEERRQLHETITSILQNIPLTLWRIGVDGNILESRGGGLTKFGLQDHDLIGSSFLELHHEMESHFHNALKGQKVSKLIEFNMNGDKVYKQLYLFQDSLTSEAIGFCLDVTDQKRAEAETQWRNFLIDQLLEQLPLVLGILDTSGNYLELRGKGLRRIGIEDNELAGQNIFDIFPELGATLVSDSNTELLNFTQKMGAKDKYAYYQILGLFDQQSQTRVSFGIDITELKEAQEKMLTEKEFSVSLLENSIDGIMAIDPLLKVTSWNMTMEKIMSKSREEVLSNSVLDIFPQQAHALIKENLHRVLQGETLFIDKVPFLRSSQSFEVNLIPLFNAEKQVIGALCLIHDNTLLHQRQLADTKSKLAQQKAIMNAVLFTQEEERKRIAESLHNSLGQLLYAAKLNAEDLITGSSETLDQKQIAVRISGFLDDAIKETRTLAHELIPTTLKEFGLKKTLKGLASKLSKDNFQVQCIVTGFDTCKDETQETAIFRIVQELLNNVMKHASATEALVQVVDKGEWIMIRVEDNGTGMPQPTPEKRTIAKGMGLTTIENRVKYMQGHMQVNSTRGQGTVVTIEVKR